MSSAKKSLQVSTRLLLRAPGGEKSGVLLRQRCTSWLRRWTARRQQNSACLDDQLRQAEINRRDLCHSVDLQCSSQNNTEKASRNSDTMDPVIQSGLRESVSRFVWDQRSAGRAGWHGTSEQHLLSESHIQRRNSRVNPYHNFAGGMTRVRDQVAHPVTCTQHRALSTEEHAANAEQESIHVTFINRDGSEKTILVPLGTQMLQAAHDNDIDLEGACEASLACSTCHVIFEDESFFEKLPEPSEEENDMLDLAFGLTPTSRLGCQIFASSDLDGVRLRIPAVAGGGAVARLNAEPSASSKEALASAAKLWQRKD